MAYKLFAGANYYPRGGYEDFIESFPSLKATRDKLLSLQHEWLLHKDDEIMDYDWAHIVHKDKIVEHWRVTHEGQGWVKENSSS